MALIAGRDIYIGRVLAHRKGSPVPGAIDWPYPALRAALNSGEIQDPDGDVARRYDWRNRLFERADARKAATALAAAAEVVEDQASELDDDGDEEPHTDEEPHASTEAPRKKRGRPPKKRE